jgi:hypothetical protein
VKKSLLSLGILRKGVFAGIVLIIFSVQFLSAQTRTLRIVTYNIEDDINGPTTPLPGLIAPPSNTTNVQAGGVVEGVGEEIIGNDPAQPLDILALEETTSNTQTVAPIVNGLNAFYNSPGVFTNSSYQATESGGNPSSGNGPNAIVFNTKTVQLLASVPVDPPGGTGNLGGVSSGKSGEYREVMRYEFAPAGVPAAASNVFYIYVSHYKSGSSSTANNANSRAGEASIVRSNMMALPFGSQIIHVGDFNTGDASEAMYGTLTAPGTNQLIDPLNLARDLTTNWDNSSVPQDLTESATYLEYRDDYHMMTTNVYFGTSGGLRYVAGSYHAFGNNGSVFYGNNVNNGYNTSLNNHLATNGPVFISAAQLYIDLTNASDHLPVVADYTIPLPTPAINNVALAGTNLIFNVANSITGAVFTVLSSTNITSPLADWTAVATNSSGGGNFTFTATNVVDQTAIEQFYILQEK